MNGHHAAWAVGRHWGAGDPGLQDPYLEAAAAGSGAQERLNTWPKQLPAQDSPRHAPSCQPCSLFKQENAEAGNRGQEVSRTEKQVPKAGGEV